MNFHTGPIAHRLRGQGWEIPRKCELEQAHVLYLFLRTVIQHGDNWRQEVTKIIWPQAEKAEVSDGGPAQV